MRLGLAGNLLRLIARVVTIVGGMGVASVSA